MKKGLWRSLLLTLAAVLGLAACSGNKEEMKQETVPAEAAQAHGTTAEVETATETPASESPTVPAE